MPYLYEQVANDLGKAIEKGVFPPGTRLPSIRNTQKQYGVSAATAMEAFARLEVKGLVEVRPKSGHFVKAPVDQGDQPGISRPDIEPGPVSVVDTAMEVLTKSSQTDGVTLGTAVPDCSILQLESLARIYARAARTHHRELGKYGDPRGLPALRTAISRLIADSGALVDPDQLLITNGAQEALNLALRTVAMAGDVIAVESPTYFGVLQAMEALDLQVLELPTHPASGIDVEILEKVARDRTIRACVLQPTYQNPLGFSMSDENKRRVVDILNRYQVPLIEDDNFGSLGLEDPRPAPARAFDTRDNVMLCSSFSKTIAPGLRLGWLSAGKHIKEVMRQKFLSNISTGTIQQRAMADFLDGNRYRRVTQGAAYIYAQRLRHLREAILRHFPNGTRCTAPRGGFFIWVELPWGHDTYQLFQVAANEGISLSPGKIFSRGNCYDHCMRLSCGKIDSDDIDAAIARLSRMLPQCRN